MRPDLENFYSQARVSCGVAPLLREDIDSPPERLLQAVWQHQRLLRDQLATIDGQPVRVFHPGFLNREGGPDFHDAVIQIGDQAVCTGDVEVDLRASGWHGHGHDRNPAFARVVLHVLWESERAAAGAPPALLVRHVLDAPLGELSLWLGSESSPSFPEALRGNCCVALRSLPADRLLELLHQAALVRLRSKAAQFQARARQVGWEQSLWEGLFRALGYKHNVWPMQRLAELRPRWMETSLTAQGTGRASQILAFQGRLLGLSGLLPAELTRSQAATDSYLRRVWDQWWRDRDQFLEGILPRSVWRLHGLRPANHPQRRLALAAAWASGTNMAERLEQWCAKEMPRSGLAGSLQELLRVDADDFWSWHWTLRSARLKSEQPLLGATRLTDLAVNVVLPWLWSRALEGNSEGVRQRIERRYFSWPAAQDNAVLRLARQRLLGGASSRLLPSAAAQQGLMQIVRDFCDHSNAVCHACKLPDILRDFVSVNKVVQK